MTIVNFMPVYAQAPVSLRLLEEHVGMARDRAQAEDVCLLLPRDSALAEAFEGSSAPMDAGLGFLYGNDSAVEVALAGFNPVPTGPRGSAATPLVSGEEWLLGDSSSKYVWPEGTTSSVKVPARTTGRELLVALGVPEEGLKALYLGYPQSVFITPDKLDEPLELSCDYVRAFTTESCMVQALAEIARTFHHESCGHCVYGHEGGFQVGTILMDITEKKGAAGDLALLRDLCPTMARLALCDVGRTLARTVLQALGLFGDEIEAHITKRQCPAGECKAFMTYHILVSRCNGCGACLDACEDDAIMGKPRFVHVIDQRRCTHCDRCCTACPQGAIVMAGAKKPKTPPRPIPCRVR